MKRCSYDVTSRSLESTIPRLWRQPYKRYGKTAGNSFAYCLVDDVKHNENDVERHEVSYMYWRCLPIKIAFLGENTGVYSIGWVIEQLFHGWFGGIDKTTAPRYCGQLDAPLPSAFRPRAVMQRAVNGTLGQQFWPFPKQAWNNCILLNACILFIGKYFLEWKKKNDNILISFNCFS